MTKPQYAQQTKKQIQDVMRKRYCCCCALYMHRLLKIEDNKFELCCYLCYYTRKSHLPPYGSCAQQTFFKITLQDGIQQ